MCDAVRNCEVDIKGCTSVACQCRVALQWSPRPDQVTHQPSQTEPKDFTLSNVCGYKMQSCWKYFFNRHVRLPGIDSLKRIMMQIFHRNIPDVNLSHLKIDWIFQMT